MRASPLQSLCSSQLFLPSPKVFPFFSLFFIFYFPQDQMYSLLHHWRNLPRLEAEMNLSFVTPIGGS